LIKHLLPLDASANSVNAVKCNAIIDSEANEDHNYQNGLPTVSRANGFPLSPQREYGNIEHNG
jgi:hypothetical protein